jgi:hypothetical protein
MKLSSRQELVSKHVFDSTLMLKDLCQMVAQYVFANPFQMKLAREFEVHVEPIVSETVTHYLLESTKLPESICRFVTSYQDNSKFNFDGKEHFFPQVCESEGEKLFLLDRIEVNLISGYTTVRRPEITCQMMNGKRWHSSGTLIYCDDIVIIDMGCRSKWLGCNELLKETYWLTYDHQIFTIDEKGKLPLPALSIPFWFSNHAFSSILKPIRKVIMPLHGGLVELDLNNETEGQRMLSSAEPMDDDVPRLQMHIFPGDTEDEVWCFRLDANSVHVFLSDKLYLKQTKLFTKPKHAKLMQIGSLLIMAEKKSKSIKISVFH